MLKHYKSNPELSNSNDIGLISLANNNFIFTAKINNLANDILDFKFIVCDESATKNYGFSLSNTSFKNYNLENDKLISEKFDKNIASVYYFDEEFQIKDEKLYKKVTDKDSPLEDWADFYIINGITYAYNKSDKIYELLINKDSYQIAKNINIKPFNINILSNDNIIDEIVYENDRFYGTDDKWFRIIVSEDAKLISFWHKNKETDNFIKIKTFSYPGGIEKAGIKLSLSESIVLSDMSFSFFETNVE